MSHHGKSASGRLIPPLMFFLVIFLPGLCQTNRNFQVVDSTKSPLPYVNVRFNDQLRGTLTNANGYFQFCDTSIQIITLSHIGYQNCMFRPDTVSTSLIVLKPVYHELKEVVIHPFDAQKIVLKAINQIGRNYTDKTHVQKAFYRESLFELNCLKKITECELVIDKTSYSCKQNDNIFIKAFKNYVVDSSHIEIVNGPISIFQQCDLIKNKSYILDQRNVSKHRFALKSISQYEDKIAYYIRFNPKKRNNMFFHEAFAGQLVIDTTNLAILYADVSKIASKKRSADNQIITKYTQINGKYSLLDVFKRINKGNNRAEVLLTINDFDYQGSIPIATKIEKGIPLKEYLSSQKSKSWTMLPDTVQLLKYFRNNTSYKPTLRFAFGNELRFRTDLFAHTFNSADNLVDYLLSNSLENGMIWSLSQTLYHYAVSSPIENVMAESALLTKNKIGHRIKPFNLNNSGSSYCSIKNEDDLKSLLAINQIDFIRLNTLRYELMYQMANETEDQLFVNSFSLNTFSEIFYLNLFLKKSALFFNCLIAGQEWVQADVASPFNDRLLNTAYYLTEKSKILNNSIQWTDLNEDGKKLITLAKWFSVLNLISPFIIGKDKISITDHVNMNFNYGYLLTPIGEAFLQNYWVKINEVPLKFETSLIKSKHKVGYILGFNLLKYPIYHNFNISSQISIWNTPLYFDVDKLTPGIGVDILMNYTISSHFDLFAGYTYKAKGYLINQLNIEKSNLLNIGCQVAF